VPSHYEPEELFRHQPSVNRRLSNEEMDQAIGDAFSADADPASV
jgi:hypothetical protein